MPARHLGNRLGLQYDANTNYQCQNSNVLHRHRALRDVDGPFTFADCEPARACFLNPENKQHAFLFANIKYIQVDVQPASIKDIIVSRPILIIDQWLCLQGAGFYVVVAVLQNPDNSYEAYFFSGDKYALIDLYKCLIVNGPHVITTMWPSLSSAGFTLIDAVLPHPKRSGQAYFFSGNMYALIQNKPGAQEDCILNGPMTIINEWPSLRNAGFGSVEIALANLDGKNEAYFFNRQKYVLINIKPESNVDLIVNGSKSVSENRHSLREALFTQAFFDNENPFL